MKLTPARRGAIFTLPLSLKFGINTKNSSKPKNLWTLTTWFPRWFFLLKKDEESRNYYQNLWEYILIDEYQDTNKSQYELSKLLSAKYKNICAIGDMDQSIYAFRGADFRNIINFERDFPNLVSVVLEENYRSTQNILEAAAKVIEKNKIRKTKDLYTKNAKGAEISLFEAMSELEEAEFTVHKIKELLAGGHRPAEIAILFRFGRIFSRGFLKRFA